MLIPGSIKRSYYSPTNGQPRDIREPSSLSDTIEKIKHRVKIPFSFITNFFNSIKLFFIKKLKIDIHQPTDRFFRMPLPDLKNSEAKTIFKPEHPEHIEEAQQALEAFVKTSKSSKITQSQYKTENITLLHLPGTGVLVCSTKSYLQKGGNKRFKQGILIHKEGEILSAKPVGVLTPLKKCSETTTAADLTSELPDIKGVMRTYGAHRYISVKRSDPDSTQNKILALTELAEKGDLEKLAEIEDLTQQKKLQISDQMIKIIARFHAKGYIHTDIKLPNFFLTKTDDVILGDLDSVINLNAPLTTVKTGTHKYFSPAYFHHLATRTQPTKETLIKHDIWGLGMAILELLGGKIPTDLVFSKRNHWILAKDSTEITKLGNDFVTKWFEQKEDVLALYPKEVTILLKKMLNPDDTTTMEDVLQEWEEIFPSQQEGKPPQDL